MTTFWATMNQTAFLFTFITLGYYLAKGKHVPDSAPAILSGLENTVFIPALVLETFLKNFRRAQLSQAGELLLQSLLLAIVVIGLSLLCVRLCTKDRYLQNIYLYGLCFSNFGFMGNAMVSALFPDQFMDYILFTLPLWTLIYLWGVPVLLMGKAGEKVPLKRRLRNFRNPMFAGMVIGMAVGLLELPVPHFLTATIAAAGECMSPVAMLLTGMTVARYDVKKILGVPSVYTVTALRLLIFPFAFLVLLAAVPLPRTFALCATCVLAMPLGLNTIIVPNALGQDTSVAAGMALISHVLSCLTIPVIFLLLEKIL